jgi:hypothetical protein
MSDGDNIQLLQNTILDPKFFGNPKRGEVPVAWTISSSIVDLLPEVYTYLLKNKTINDYFVSAPSGEGYSFPNIYPKYLSYLEKMKKFMQKFGMKTVNILDSQDFPKRDLIDEMAKFTNAIFYFPYGDYSLWNGKIRFINDNAAIIGGRYRLWSQFNSPDQIAEKLNKLSNNINSYDGYSLIPVHLWSEGYEGILKTYDLLDKEKVEVLGLDEFVEKILKNINH